MNSAAPTDNEVVNRLIRHLFAECLTKFHKTCPQDKNLLNLIFNDLEIILLSKDRELMLRAQGRLRNLLAGDVMRNVNIREVLQKEK